MDLHVFWTFVRAWFCLVLAVWGMDLLFGLYGQLWEPKPNQRRMREMKATTAALIILGVVGAVTLVILGVAGAVAFIATAL